LCGAEAYLFVGTPVLRNGVPGYAWWDCKSFTDEYGGFCFEKVRFASKRGIAFVSVRSHGRVVIPFVEVNPGNLDRVRVGPLLALEGAVRIAGSISDQAASPVPGGVVCLAKSPYLYAPEYSFPVEFWKKIATVAVTGVRGKYVFDKVNPGTYTIVAYVGGKPAGVREIKVKRYDDGHVFFASFVVVREPRVSGLVEAHGRPLAGAGIELFDIDGKKTGEARTGTDGLFSIADNGVRPVFIRASKERFTTFESGAVADIAGVFKIDLIEAVPVSLRLKDTAGQPILISGAQPAFS